MEYPKIKELDKPVINTAMLAPPAEESEHVELEKGPNIQPLPL
jgi:hypothetical protein